MSFDDPQFWIAVLQIIAIDIVLGGDNAVVIALACRRLPEDQRKLGIFWGVFGTIALRVVLIFFALSLLAIPYLKIVGAALLLWIGVKLLQPESEGEHEIDASTTLIGAIKTIIVADAVMSLDNVIAIAGAAKDEMGLVILGLIALDKAENVRTAYREFRRLQHRQRLSGDTDSIYHPSTDAPIQRFARVEGIHLQDDRLVVLSLWEDIFGEE